MFVTTSFDPGENETEAGQKLAAGWNVPFLARGRKSLKALFEEMKTDRAVIIGKNEWRYEEKNGFTFYFHPNMSALRVKHLMDGQPDRMVTAANLGKGDHVLDCTLGMGADAIVASYVVGTSGRVVALESEPVIAEIVRHGLRHYETDRKSLIQAMRRVEVVSSNYQSYLQECEDQSFDVVMFDPMFRETVEGSAGIHMLKPLANATPLEWESVQEAVRVARKAVLLKERPKSGEFERLGFTIVKSSSSYAWGVIEKGGGQ
ncbi:class I SAM-dependent methyltransferase [Thermoactinomyces mirandus]|uniref:Class I SAM-dependent methyltransferase n=1 Tax=Thermoactinomyces mirandus TaxID=2756294 RepID=A0A7W1XS91_9BACL|nr:class I SAM-dependent methyltransferase [Thermoactinomyces mirandus]MBA4602352.1 class I SAM-dependent methyltransferase [Thermoactinomyces mirandus]